MPSLNTPIFLLGTQRSGSTLLTRMLSMHSSLFMQNEMALQGLFDAPIGQDELYHRIVNRLHEQHKIDVNELQANGVQWGWKEPLLTPYLETVKDHFPDSKYIVLVRDPRAVVASYIDNKWGLGTNAYTGALRWLDEVSKQLEFYDKYADQSFLIKYEDLLAHPEQSLSAICEFLALPFEQSMVEYYKKPLEFDQNKSNVNTMKPLNTKGISKWKQVFSEAQIGITARKQMSR